VVVVRARGSRRTDSSAAGLTESMGGRLMLRRRDGVVGWSSKVRDAVRLKFFNSSDCVFLVLCWLFLCRVPNFNPVAQLHPVESIYALESPVFWCVDGA